MNALRRAATILFCLIVFGCGQDRNEKDEINVGVLVPLTGSAAPFGQNVVRGVELAIEDVQSDSDYSNMGIQVHVEDSRGSPDGAVSGLRKLIDVDGIDVLIGDVTSSATNAIIPIITAEMVPTISPSASDPALTGASPYFARVWPSDVYEAEVIANFGINVGLDNLAIIYINNDYGAGMLNSFKSVFPDDQIAFEAAVPDGFSDFRPLLQRVLRENADGVFIIAFPASSRAFLQQSAELEFGIPVLATATAEDDLVSSAPNAERVFFAAPRPANSGEITRQSFGVRYEQKFSEQPGTLSDTGYDAATLLLKGMKNRVGNENVEIINYVKGLEGYDGVSGAMSFQESGDVIKAYDIKTVRDQEFIWNE